MDPVAHTLIGATMAEAGLKRWSRYATPALLIGANLPDIDGIANFWGRDASLYFRRGWSHGVLALVVLPLVLAAAFWLWHRWRYRRRETPAAEPSLRMQPLILLCFMAVWSHPLLDWLNTYGVRLLMPFDGRWFYGDTLFIVDLWFWLLTAVGVFLARSHSRAAIAGWLVLGSLATVLVFWTDQLPLWVKITWLAGVGSICALRWRRTGAEVPRTAARAGLAGLCIYIGAMYGLARLAESVAIQETAAQHPNPPKEAHANPLPGTPLRHRVVLVYDTHYQIVNADGEVQEVPRGPFNPVVQRALEDESIKGFVNWMRFPYWEITETEHSWIVEFRDLRYVGPGQADVGIGTAQVEVEKQPR